MKRAISIFLVIIMLLTAAPLSGLVDADLSGLFGVKAEAFSVGDHIQFGSYPQSRVTDESLIAQLEATSATWVSYGYYSGTGQQYDGQMKPSDYMKYRDAVVDGVKYRAVRFTAYRPDCGGDTQSASNSYQDENGYNTDTTYWFRFDPISWRILDPSSGLILSETVLDSQAYNNFVLKNSNGSLGNGYYGDSSSTYWASNYYYSSIRKWLNEDFYETAFTDSQKDIIKTTHLENKSTLQTAYDAPDSNDKIYLLSYWDSINPSYGFSSQENNSDAARRVLGSDYAKSQGLWLGTFSDYPDNPFWWLRSPYRGDSARFVNWSGSVSGGVNIDFNGCGVRPACTLSDLKSDQVSCTHKWDDGIITSDSTCSAEGEKTYTCAACGRTKTEAIAKKPHTPEVIPAVEATCSEEGKTEGSKCSVCGTIIIDQTTVAKIPHTPEVIPAVEATCSEEGKTEGIKCSVCGTIITAQTTVAKIPHTPEVIPAVSATCSATGLTEGSKCSVCGTIIKAQKTIAKASGVKISATSFTYNEKVQKPTLTVKDSAGKTIAASDYTAKWSNANSKAVGKYTVKITFKGNYSGTKTLTYKIVPRQVTGLKAVSVAKDSIKLSWTSLAEAKRYKLEYSTDSKKWTTFDTVSRNNVTVDSLKAGKKYQFRVTALNADETISGKTSAVLNTGTLTAAPKISSLKSTKAKTATVTWGKVTGAKSYTVYTSTDGKNFKAAKTGVTGTSLTLTKLAAGKKIYLKIVAVNAYGKNSAASTVKSVIVKK